MRLLSHPPGMTRPGGQPGTTARAPSRRPGVARMRR